ncbi:MAG TPA: amino acid permease [Gemmatimonadales bacterium]|jgi:amino acid transporter
MSGAAETQGLADRWGERLPRRLGLLSAIAVVIGSTIGSGIYRTPARIAEAVPAPGWMLGVWVLGGLLALCGALTYAELGGMFPRSGGVFVYIKEGFGRMPAFLFGWTELVVIRASALGAIATVFAEYLLRSLGYDPRVYADAVHYVAAGAIAVTGICNYIGVDWSALLLNVTTWVRYFALLALVFLAFLLGHGDTTHFVQADGVVHFEPFVASLVAVLWAYDGWGDVSFVGGEVANPERNLPRAFIIGTLGVIAIYLLVNVAYLYLLPISLERHSPLVAADAAQLIMGRAGVAAIGVVVVISTFGTLAGSMLTGPRIFFAMADAGLFFKGIAAVHPRFKTPSRAITLAAILAIAYVLVRRFEGLSDTFVLAIWPFYALAAASVMVLRRRDPERPRPVRTLGYPLPPLIFILSAILILAIATKASPRDPIIAFSVILTGIPAFLVWRSRQPAKG